MINVLVETPNLDKVFESHIEKMASHINAMHETVQMIEEMIIDVSILEGDSGFRDLKLNRKNDRLYALLGAIGEELEPWIDEVKTLMEPLTEERVDPKMVKSLKVFKKRKDTLFLAEEMAKLNRNITIPESCIDPRRTEDFLSERMVATQDENLYVISENDVTPLEYEYLSAYQK